MKSSPPPEGRITQAVVERLFRAGWIELVPYNPSEPIRYTPEGEIAAKLLSRFLAESDLPEGSVGCVPGVVPGRVIWAIRFFGLMKENSYH